MSRIVLVAAAVIMLAACRQSSSSSSSSESSPSTPPKAAPAGESEFSRLTDDFVKGALALSPVSATQAGYHQHHEAVLDERLDDYSPAGIEAQRTFFHDM